MPPQETVNCYDKNTFIFFIYPRTSKHFASQESPPKAGQIIQAKGFSDQII